MDNSSVPQLPPIKSVEHPNGHFDKNVILVVVFTTLNPSKRGRSTLQNNVESTKFFCRIELVRRYYVAWDGLVKTTKDFCLPLTLYSASPDKLAY